MSEDKLSPNMQRVLLYASRQVPVVGCDRSLVVLTDIKGNGCETIAALERRGLIQIYLTPAGENELARLILLKSAGKAPPNINTEGGGVSEAPPAKQKTTLDHLHEMLRRGPRL